MSPNVSTSTCSFNVNPVVPIKCTRPTPAADAQPYAQQQKEEQEEERPTKKKKEKGGEKGEGGGEAVHATYVAQ